MLAYILRKLPGAFATLLLASIAIFLLIHLLPGSPAVLIAGPDATPEVVKQVERELGLDKPLPVSYMYWINGILRGDLGQSYISRAPISTLIASRVFNSLELMLVAIVLAVVIGFTLGALAALTKSNRLQLALAGVNAFMISIPPFVTGLVLILVLSVMFRMLPTGGQAQDTGNAWEMFKHVLMPALTLAIPTAAVIARFLQTSLRHTLREDYIRTAIAKGLSPGRVVLRHAMPAALAPVVTIVGIQMGQLLGGAVIVESVFAWPGLARLLIDAVLSHDYLLVQDVLLLSVIVFMIMQITTDVAHAALDPRTSLKT